MGFYLKLLSCLLTRQNYFSCFGQQIAMFRVEALSRSCKIQKDKQGLHVIWAGKSLVNAVSTLQPPLCITLIPIKMNLPFCFYFSTSFAETANSFYFNLLKKYSSKNLKSEPLPGHPSQGPWPMPVCQFRAFRLLARATSSEWELLPSCFAR